MLNEFDVKVDLLIAKIITHSTKLSQGDEEADNFFYEYIKLISELFSNEQGINAMKILINALHPSVRMVGAYHLLPYEAKLAEKTLKKLAKIHLCQVDFYSKSLLQDWKKGTLRFPRWINEELVLLTPNELLDMQSSLE
ncbi:MAG: hypothetical protein FWF06_08400 [Symbiobacteriaceae bacterium]|nr:hypothetical protein [Symbiobacteriaceae bacterium]